MYVIDNNELYHHGIKGQKWGVRRFQNPDGTRIDRGRAREIKRNTKMAKKDAKEYARAKMYYGEGAGNRRKLIKARVNERSKDKDYKEKFDKFLNEQNMESHAHKAVQERHARDTAEATRKAIRKVPKIMATAASVALSVATIYTVANQLGLTKKVKELAGNVKMSVATNKLSNQSVDDFLKSLK